MAINIINRDGGYCVVQQWSHETVLRGTREKENLQNRDKVRSGKKGLNERYGAIAESRRRGGSRAIEVVIAKVNMLLSSPFTSCTGRENLAPVPARVKMRCEPIAQILGDCGPASVTGER